MAFDIHNVELSIRTLRVIKKWIANAFGIPPRQVSRVLFHGLILANIIAGFWLLDSLKDPILSDTVGMKYQPFAKFLSVGTTLFVVCVYDFLTSVVSKPALFHIISFLFGTIMLILSAFLSKPEYGFGNDGMKGPHQVIGWLTYFAVEAYGSLMVALFWSFTNSIMDLEEAKGVYGLIIAIAQIGAILGSTLATNAHSFGIPTLFVMGSMLIYSVSLLVKTYHLVYQDYATQSLRSRVRSESESSSFDPLLPSTSENEGDSLLMSTATINRPQPNQQLYKNKNESSKDISYYSTEEEGFTECMTRFSNSVLRIFGGFYEGLSLIMRYPYVLKLLGVSCLYEIVVTILDYEFKLMGSHAAAHGSLIPSDASDRFANLLGHFGQVTNIISFLLSFFGFSYLVHHIGVQRSLMIFPTVLFVAVIVSYLVPSLWVLFIFVSILKGMIFSLHDPVKELLYIPTSESIKFKAKAWIDVFGSRLMKAGGSLITSISMGNPQRLRQIAEIPAIALTIVILFVTWSIGTDFYELVENNKVVGDELARLRYDVDMDGPIINGLKPGDVGYQGYDPDLFVGVFEEEDDFAEENPMLELKSFPKSVDDGAHGNGVMPNNFPAIFETIHHNIEHSHGSR